MYYIVAVKKHVHFRIVALWRRLLVITRTILQFYRRADTYYLLTAHSTGVIFGTLTNRLERAREEMTATSFFCLHSFRYNAQ